jgi:transcriptional regulator with XRE-family HTH domain
MNTRLQQFLSLENLTPARLADILGVQRSGMSHILSGRNKPGYDFILKMCLKFPDLNANWFITGKGKPYLERNTSTIPSSVVSGPSATQANFNQSQHTDNLFDRILDPKEENCSSDFSDTMEDAIDFSGNPTDNQHFTQENTASYPHENQMNAENSTKGHKNKRVKRVIIFYNDGSFEELFPSL